MSSAAFPLPRAPQHAYTKWYNFTAKSGTFSRYTILWVGSMLDCRFKSETVSSIIGPHNVFILKKNSTFAYAIMDNTETLYRLPKKFHTACFPGIQYSSVPTNNRINVKITKRSSIELPFIPHTFLQQKKLKGSRLKRKRSQSSDVTSQIEQIDFSKRHPSWHVLNNDLVKDVPVKKELLVLIRSMMNYAIQAPSFRLKDPFLDIFSLEDLKNDENRMKTLKLIVSFIFHYCRSEFGCSEIPVQTGSSISLQSWISDLNNTEIE